MERLKFADGSIVMDEHMANWFPIETAPSYTQGRAILTRDASGHTEYCLRMGGMSFRLDNGRAMVGYRPVEWTPLPAPPDDKESR